MSFNLLDYIDKLEVIKVTSSSYTCKCIICNNYLFQN